ncbi:MAG: single-stranded DNA-binding protein [Bacilli bacterium]
MALNLVGLSGRLTTDIDYRKTPTGKAVTNFTLAVDKDYKQDGQPSADFIKCQAWGKIADLLNEYCKKGSLLNVSGRIQTRSYDDKVGKKVYITEVVVDKVQFIDAHKAQQSNESNYTSKYSNEQEKSFVGTSNEATEQNNGNSFEIEADDLPF